MIPTPAIRESLISLDLHTNSLFVRVLGYGLSVRVRGTYRELFSERNRLVPFWDLGPLRVAPLTPIFSKRSGISGIREVIRQTDERERS